MVICKNNSWVFCIAVTLGGYSACINAEELPRWPENSVAISLSYDDSLSSQLDVALPALQHYGLKASFYVLPSSDLFQKRLAEWREVAKAGYELGNHTLKHSCSGSKQNRDWVTPSDDLDTQTANALASEVRLANTLLQAVDGKTKRTFTIPCGDVLAGGENYVEIVSDEFVAIKGQGIESGFSSLYAPDGVSAKDLIAHVEQQAAEVRLINILFHGVGGDYLSVSSEAHDQLLNYLADNKHRYWIDTYLNIMSAHKSDSIESAK
ncbi:MAG: peptidoglycan/xylan/chitin deacetylase (PgdA/CDA1 family) [Arenicella sp.]|jgi:peptidoglycan/xylan/chitin deacetylase (PgdA/CDA1 family)